VTIDDILAAPPRPPADPDLFSSNALFGQPGIYPQGSPMTPAPGPAPDLTAAATALAAIGIDDASAQLAETELARRAPDPGPRGGLVALRATVGAPLVDAFLAGDTDVEQFAFGVPASPGRIVGPPARSPSASRVVNERYAGEHPALFAGSLAHDLLWSGEDAGQYEEVSLHCLCAIVHAQLLARAPALARRGTELARRQNSLVITLLNSRHPGSADIAVVAPDGPGTIPGGDPNMQTPDFWSIPFVGGPPRAGDAPPLLAAVLARVTGDGSSPPVPVRYDAGLGTWLTVHGLLGALPRAAQLRAATALGLVDGAADGSSR
jgi:hypothetical protein